MLPGTSRMLVPSDARGLEHRVGGVDGAEAVDPEAVFVNARAPPDPTVALQTPSPSLLQRAVRSLANCPLTATSRALGARTRKVTCRSAATSGETTGGAGRGAAAAAGRGTGVDGAVGVGLGVLGRGVPPASQGSQQQDHGRGSAHAAVLPVGCASCLAGWAGLLHCGVTVTKRAPRALVTRSSRSLPLPSRSLATTSSAEVTGFQSTSTMTSPGARPARAPALPG